MVFCHDSQHIAEYDSLFGRSIIAVVREYVESLFGSNDSIMDIFDSDCDICVSAGQSYSLTYIPGVSGTYHLSIHHDGEIIREKIKITFGEEEKIIVNLSKGIKLDYY